MTQVRKKRLCLMDILLIVLAIATVFLLWFAIQTDEGMCDSERSEQSFVTRAVSFLANLSREEVAHGPSTSFR